LLGLALYATGALLFFPAAQFQIFGFFLVSLYILTFGLAFLETTANPYILSMGDERTATRRLNLAQSFNPMGSLIGMTVASKIILKRLQSDARDDVTGELIYPTLDAATKAVQKAHDLIIIRNPYVFLGFVVITIFIVIALTKMPTRKGADHTVHALDSFKRLIRIPKYREGVIAQVFYVAAQIMCWTFIIQYAENLGITKATAQNYNIVAMCIFLSSRFISTLLMKYIDSKKLLMFFAIGGMLTTSGVILIEGMAGLYCLVATSAFMSLMFPTIYGIALEGIGDDATIGSAGLVMAIVGGALMPPLQGALIDLGRVGSLPAVNFSFILPFVCFIVIGFYGYRAIRVFRVQTAQENM
jgi:FHS family L-fucose permease-like MFS transporter